MRCSEPGNIAPTTASPAGVSATHGSDALTSKKMAPVRRTVRSTSDKASIVGLRGRSSMHAGRAAMRPSAAGRYTLQPLEPERYYTERHMSNEKVHECSCFCGEVQFEVGGEPAAMGYCHCASCRQWSAGPVNAFTLWSPQAVKVIQGAASIGT